MATFLFKVEDRFVIPHRGLVLFPGLGDKAALVKTGSSIRLIRPDKSEIVTSIKGITTEANHDILIPLTSDDVPMETEVWTID